MGGRRSGCVIQPYVTDRRGRTFGHRAVTRQVGSSRHCEREPLATPEVVGLERLVVGRYVRRYLPQLAALFDRLGQLERHDVVADAVGEQVDLGAVVPAPPDARLLGEDEP